MTKILKLFLLLAFGALFAAIGWQYASADAKGQGGASPTQTAQASPMPTVETCKVITGIDGGTVNLRACPGAACGAVLDILTEGASLDIITAGEWMNVTTDSGVTGWLNKKYCEVRP